MIKTLKVVLALSLICVLGHSLAKNSAIAEFKEVDFHNYPVTQDAPQIKSNFTKPAAKTESYSTTTKTTTDNKNSKNKKTAKNSKKSSPKNDAYGSIIPEWVYSNTVSSDAYYKVITSNSIFITTADCPKGKAMMDDIKKAISQTSIKSKFADRTELKPVGSSVLATCHKTYKNGVCQAKSSKDCKCAIHYLMSNCRNSVCIINAKERRIAKVKPNYDVMVNKFQDISKKW